MNLEHDTKKNKKISIVCFGNQWDKYRRRYRSIMSRLAKYEHIDYIIYIEPALPLTSMVKYLLGKADQDAKNWWDRIFKSGFILYEDNVVIIPSLIPIPFFTKGIAQDINLWCLKSFRKIIIRYFMRKFNISSLILWISHPYFTKDFMNEFNKNLKIYDLCDDYAEKHQLGSQLRRILKDNDEYISKTADIKFVSSEELYEKKKQTGKEVIRVSNGVDYTLFVNGSNNYIPQELVGLNRPILFYLGRINDRVNLEILIEVASEHPEWTIVCVGPIHHETVGLNRCMELKNIYFLGDRPYIELPPYLKNIDVCILPHRKTPLTKTMDPIKIYNYLASGKPIVSTEISGVERFSDVIGIAKNPGEFVEKIETALKCETPELSQKRLLYAKENSWDVKVEQIHRIIISKISDECPAN